MNILGRDKKQLSDCLRHWSQFCGRLPGDSSSLCQYEGCGGVGRAYQLLNMLHERVLLLCCQPGEHHCTHNTWHKTRHRKGIWIPRKTGSLFLKIQNHICNATAEIAYFTQGSIYCSCAPPAGWIFFFRGTDILIPSKRLLGYKTHDK